MSSRISFLIFQLPLACTYKEFLNEFSPPLKMVLHRNNFRKYAKKILETGTSPVTFQFTRHFLIMVIKVLFRTHTS